MMTSSMELPSTRRSRSSLGECGKLSIFYIEKQGCVVMFDFIHIEHYRNLKLLKTVLYAIKTGECNQGQLNCIIGAELEIYKANLERAKGNKVDTEVEIEGTRVDILINDEIAIEVKCRRKINNTVIKQLKKYKRVYRDVRLFICKDTIVEDESQILKYATIERADISKEEIIERALKLF